MKLAFLLLMVLVCLSFIECQQNVLKKDSPSGLKKSLPNKKRPSLPKKISLPAVPKSYNARKVTKVTKAKARQLTRPVVARGQRPRYTGFFGNIARRFGRFFRPRRPNTVGVVDRKHKVSRNQKNRRKFRKDPNVPAIALKRAEDMPGWEKFTLDEVIYPSKETDKGEDRADTKEEVLKYIDSVQKVEEEQTEAEEEVKEVVKEEKEVKIEEKKE